MLVDFYQARGADETTANEIVSAQTKKVRTWVIPIGLSFLLAGVFANNVVTESEFRLVGSISIYFGICLLACQLPRGTKSTASWESLKSLFKKSITPP